MSELTAGLASCDITPPVGSPMAGYGARDHGCESVETPLIARALVLENSGSYAALICADLISTHRELTTSIRESVAEQTDIPAEAIIVCGSHTHWGPEIRPSGYMPRALREAIPQPYLDCLARTLAGCAVEAWRRRQPAWAGAGAALADGISFSRRPVGTDGKVVMSLVLQPQQAAVAAREGLTLWRAWRKGGDGGPRLSPPLKELDGLRAGVSDPEAPLLKVVGPDAKPLAGLANFACHPVVGGEGNFYAISPDYPGEARRAFEPVVGAPLVFSLGCAGNQVPAWRGGDSRERVGRSLGAALTRAWYQIRDCTRDAPVATAVENVTLPLKPLPDLEEARAALAACEDPESPAACGHRQQVAMAEKYQGASGIETQVWACRIGDWAAVALPGEIMVEIGLQIKQHSPFVSTAVISCAYDSIGYVSTDKAHDEGGYEPEWSPAGVGAERALVDAAIRLLSVLANA
ncbi:MAG: hypothetical protein HPY44_00190 [Armatimonadetes bacterium]|nr:hypothetical protein [Armatimonadota bacterium]